MIEDEIGEREERSKRTYRGYTPGTLFEGCGDTWDLYSVVLMPRY